MAVSSDASTSPDHPGRATRASTIRAVFFDFGGVITTSPFHAFARYEQDHGLPAGFIRRVNSTNPDHNAWARFERREIDIDGFRASFEFEARNLGHGIDGRAVLDLVAGEVRPAMLEAIDRIKAAGLVTACLTNNFVPVDADGSERQDPPPQGNESRWRQAARAMSRFDHVIQSSVIGVRKPEVGFYRVALDVAGVDPTETVFLDDLGVNLKPAKAMGMTTIKVTDPEAALGELEKVLGLSLSG
jgi:putative hydrolase of the HAD superfamily